MSSTHTERHRTVDSSDQTSLRQMKTYLVKIVLDAQIERTLNWLSSRNYEVTDIIRDEEPDRVTHYIIIAYLKVAFAN